MNRNPLNRRGLAVVPVTVTILIAGIVACRDALLPSRNDVQLTRASQVSDARSHLRSRNPNDWVGTAHNKAIDDFRRRLTVPGRPIRNICDAVTDFVLEPARIPESKRTGKAVDRSIAVAAVTSQSLCAGRAPKVRRTVLIEPGHAPFVQPSEDAYEILAQVEMAVEQASDVNDLASRLVPLLDAATALPEAEHAALSATISVTQNSFEYWNANFGGLASEVISQYSPCVTEHIDDYGDEGLADRCIRGDSPAAEMRNHAPTSRRPFLSMASLQAPRDCPSDPTPGIKRIIKADAEGAFGGAWAGAFAGGFQGALLGAVVGAGGRSILRGVQEGWNTMMCIYGL